MTIGRRAILRLDLSAVFTKLRQQNPNMAEVPMTATDAGDVVDRLDRLASLLERNLISEDEFAKLKADLLSDAE